MPGTNRSHKKLVPLSAVQQQALAAELAATAEAEEAEVAAFTKKRAPEIDVPAFTNKQVVEPVPEPEPTAEPAPKPKPPVIYIEDLSFSAAKVRGRRVVITVED